MRCGERGTRRRTFLTADRQHANATKTQLEPRASTRARYANNATQNLRLKRDAVRKTTGDGGLATVTSRVGGGTNRCTYAAKVMTDTPGGGLGLTTQYLTCETVVWAGARPDVPVNSFRAGEDPDLQKRAWDNGSGHPTLYSYIRHSRLLWSRSSRAEIHTPVRKGRTRSSTRNWIGLRVREQLRIFLRRIGTRATKRYAKPVSPNYRGQCRDTRCAAVKSAVGNLRSSSPSCSVSSGVWCVPPTRRGMAVQIGAGLKILRRQKGF